MPPTETSLVSFTPAHPVRGYVHTVHFRIMCLILVSAAAVAVVFAVTGLQAPQPLWPLLVVIAVVVPLALGYGLLATRRSRIEVTAQALTLYKGRQRPLTMPRERLGVVREFRDFRAGLGAGGPYLIFFDTAGMALMTMSGHSWSAPDRAALLAAFGSAPVEIVSEPMDRKRLLTRFPDAVPAVTKAKLANQRFLNYVVLLIAAGVIGWALITGG